MFVYVIKSIKTNRSYIGHTSNLNKRLKEHNSGKTKSTKGYLPWKLLFFEEYPSRSEAIKRERYLKSGIGREYISKLFSEKIS